MRYLPVNHRISSNNQCHTIQETASIIFACMRLGCVVKIRVRRKHCKAVQGDAMRLPSLDWCSIIFTANCTSVVVTSRVGT